MKSKEVIQILAYLSNIFSHIINLSVSIHEKNIKIQNLCEVLNSFKEKKYISNLQGVREQTKKI